MRIALGEIELMLCIYSFFMLFPICVVCFFISLPTLARFLLLCIQLLQNGLRSSTVQLLCFVVSSLLLVIVSSPTIKS